MVIEVLLVKMTTFRCADLRRIALSTDDQRRLSTVAIREWRRDTARRA
jgi:hypothetical protein